MIIEATNEDFENHWLFKDDLYRDKIVLDMGGDFGSTAECFLHYGAKKIISIDSDEKCHKELLNRLESNRLPKDKVISIHKAIVTSQDFIQVINDYPCDIAKIDIEAYEQSLVGVPNNILRMINEYIIEAHRTDTKFILLDLFIASGFDFKIEKEIIKGIHVIYLTRR